MNTIEVTRWWQPEKGFRRFQCIDRVSDAVIFASISGTWSEFGSEME